MKTSVTTKTVLAISGVLAITVGGALLIDPSAFHASTGINLGNDVNLLSEVRAPGGALFASGLLIAAGAFRSRFAPTSLLISGMIYLSYGLSRLFGMIVDGIPQESLVTAMSIEIALGLLSFFMLLTVSNNKTATEGPACQR